MAQETQHGRRDGQSHGGVKEVERFSRTLPCGHALQCSVTLPALAADMAKYWFDGRQPRHRCELVSAENPNGLAPLKGRVQ